MRILRRVLPHPPWPEQRLAWAERERDCTRWMHRASDRAWALRGLCATSRVGDGWIWYLVMAALPWAGGPSGFDCMVRMLAVGAVNLLVYRILKRTVARPRPYVSCADIRACTPALDEFSFPSGHTLHAVAYSFILCTYYPSCTVFVWAFAGLVAASRMVLGLHYPSDVLAGAAIGMITAAASFNAF